MSETKIRTQAWRDGDVVATDFDLERALELGGESGAVWIDIAGTDASALDPIAERLNLDANSIEDAFSAHERPKLDRFPDHQFLNCYSIRFDPDTGRLSKQEVSVFVTERVFITVHPDTTLDPIGHAQEYSETHDLLRYGVSGLLHGLLDVVVDGYLDSLQNFDDSIEDLEDTLFDDTPRSAQVQRRIYTLRRSLAQLRRAVLPMREVLDTLLRREYHLIDDELQPYFRDIRDHVLRASEWTDSLREMLTTSFETSLSLQDARLNNVMKKLTSWAAIIAVPTAVTGWYGQNVPYPGIDKTWGFWLSSVIIAVVAVVLYASFRKRGWL
jgi:magnesium transporter